MSAYSHDDLDEDGTRTRQALPPIPPFSLVGSLSPLLLAPMTVPVLVALLAPDKILDMWPWLRHFTDWVQGMVPFVRMSGHADSTIYPQVALLVHSLTLTVIPITSLVWLWQTIVNYPYLLKRRRAMGRFEIEMHLMILFVGPPLFLGLLYFFIVLPGDPSYAKGFTTHSRGGFALLTFITNYCTSAVLGGQLINLRLFIDTYLRKED